MKKEVQPISPNIDRIRILPPPNIRQEVETLMVMENLDKVEDKQYRNWLIKRLREFYPDVMNRLYGIEEKVNKEEKQ